MSITFMHNFHTKDSTIKNINQGKYRLLKRIKHVFGSFPSTTQNCINNYILNNKEV